MDFDSSQTQEQFVQGFFNMFSKLVDAAYGELEEGFIDEREDFEVFLKENIKLLMQQSQISEAPMIGGMFINHGTNAFMKFIKLCKEKADSKK